MYTSKWFGLTLKERLPKNFWGIVLEDSACEDENLSVVRYENGARQKLFEINLIEIALSLCSLEETAEDPFCSKSSDFLRKFIILSGKEKCRIPNSEKICITVETKDIIIEEYCSLFQGDTFPDELPDENEVYFPDDLSDWEDDPEEFDEFDD